MNTYKQWLINELSEEAEPVDAQALKWYASSIATKLGEKANTYAPLIRSLSAKPQMLQLLLQLIDDLGSMRTSVAGGLQKRFQTRTGA